MAERRSLSSAMELTPEKLAFIQGSKTHHSQIGELAESNPRPEVQKPKVPDSPPVPRRPTSEHRQREKSQPTSETLVGSMLDGLLVPLTTRLQPQTADALRRAYLEQKLRRQSPATQQEIVETALQGWLRREGYL